MFEIIEKIFVFLVAASMVIQLAPNESSKKCMRLFSGLILLLIISNFIVGIFSLEVIDIEDLFDYKSEIWMNNDEDYEEIFNEHYGNMAESKNSE